jgi:hypothetical protein
MVKGTSASVRIQGKAISESGIEIPSLIISERLISAGMVKGRSLALIVLE